MTSPGDVPGDILATGSGEETLAQLRRNGASIHYETHGSGAPILLTHGVGATSRMWDEQVEEFTDRYRLILWDLPGHGQSEPSTGTLTANNLTKDILAILDAAEAARAVLIGLGAGGLMKVPGGQASLSDVTHVVLTCDGTAATLFINGMPNPTQQAPAGMSFVRNTTGRQCIGAGGPFFADRVDQTPATFFPAFPFNGTIQDVAIYVTELDASTITVHLQNGIGNFTDQQAT